MFYRFVGVDKLQNFQLAKILFFDNQALEKEFRNFFGSLTKESMRQDSKKDVKHTKKEKETHSESPKTKKPPEVLPHDKERELNLKPVNEL